MKTYRCETCGTSFEAPACHRRRFCSTACYGISNRGEGSPRYKTPEDSVRIESRCQTCGEAFSHYPSAAPKYCSFDCRSRAYRGSGNPNHRSFVEQFWSRVDESRGVRACWPWQGAVGGDGYGKFKTGGDVSGRHHYRAHRVAYMLWNAEDPSGKLVCHSCDNPRCCNPRHLWLGSPAENTRDAARKKRMARPRGESNASAKLTADMVRRIRFLGKTMSQSEIGERFGVSQRHVGRILRRERWAHID